MKTITLVRPGCFGASESPAPAAPRAGHALVRVRRVGICGTDLHAYRGRQPYFSYPRILGHELGVEVEAAGAGENPSGIRAGDRCAVEPYLHCGRCRACRAGRTNCCASLKTLGVHVDGGMREWIEVPIEKLHRSSSLSLDQLALVETLGIGAHAVARAALSPGEDVLVIGAGPIGLAVIQFAALAGARVAVLEIDPRRAEFCQRIVPGVRAVAAAGGPGGAASAIEAAFDGELPAAVFDATGSAPSMAAAFRYAGQGGRLVLVGLVDGDIAFSDPEFHRRELTLLASRNSTASEFRRIIALFEAGSIDTRPWITHRAGYEDFIPRFESFLDPAQGVVKAMLEL
jgi:threonine dehydrogenase-like Zn-dependent dehydrogenase